MPSDFKKKVIKNFRKLDIFSQPVQLFIKQENGHKTLFGAVLTVMIASLFCYMLAISIKTMYLRTNPTSFMTEVFHEIPENFKYHSSNLTITFALQNSDFFTYIDESVYIAEAFIFKKNITTINGKKESNWIQTQVPLAPCSDDLIRQGDLKEYFNQLDLPTNYCIDWNKIDEINLQGSFDTQDFSFLMIQIKMCNDSTKKSKECKSNEEIRQHLEQNYFSLQMSDLVIDITQDNPCISKGQDTYTAVSSKLFKETQMFLQPINILTDVGVISEDYQSQKTLRYKRQTETIDLNGGDLILNLAIRLDQVEQQYYRNYSKVQTILSQMGGLWQVFFTVAYIISKPINLLSYYIRILNSLFSFEQENIQNSIIQQPNENEFKNSGQLFHPDKRMSLASEPMSPTYKKIEKALLRLNSIQEKEKKIQLIEKSNDPNHQEKARLSNAISFSIKKYFQQINKKLTLTLTDYIYFLSCFVKSRKHKSQQIQYSVSKLYKQMDILYLMKKLQEIDRLKMILLNESQIKLFDYLQKPVIPLDPHSKAFNINQQYYSILKPSKNTYQRAQEAKIAFQEIIQNLENPTNIKLISSIDKEIISLLTMKQSNPDLALLQSDSIEENEQVVINSPAICEKQNRKTSNILDPKEWNFDSSRQEPY